jgi:hypothetical protein
VYFVILLFCCIVCIVCIDADISMKN